MDSRTVDSNVNEAVDGGGIDDRPPVHQQAASHGEAAADKSPQQQCARQLSPEASVPDRALSCLTDERLLAQDQVYREKPEGDKAMASGGAPADHIIGKDESRSVDQLLTILPKESSGAISPSHIAQSFGGGDQPVAVASYQLTEATNKQPWPLSASSSAAKRVESPADTEPERNSPLVGLQAQVVVDHRIEHQALQSASSAHQAVGNDGWPLEHPLATEELARPDVAKLMPDLPTASLLPVPPAEELSVAISSPVAQSAPPCDNLLWPSRHSALASPLPPAAVSAPASTSIAHQSKSDITRRATSHATDSSTDADVTRQRPEQTSKRRSLGRPSQTNATSRHSKPSTAPFNLEREQSQLSFLASYPPPPQSDLRSSPALRSIASSESFTEHTPLLRSSPSKYKGADSTSSLSSSTLSLFLASLKVNTGSVSTEKNPLGTFGSKLIGSIRAKPSTSQGLNSPISQHPLSSPPGSPSFESSRLMPTNASPSPGSIPLKMVSTVSDSDHEPSMVKLNLLQRATTETGIESMVSFGAQAANGSFVNGSSPANRYPMYNGNGNSSHIASPHQRYMASLLNTEGTSHSAANGAGLTSRNIGGEGAEMTTSGQYLSYKPYPTPKSNTAPAVTSASQRHHCPLPKSRHRCYASSGSFDGATHGLTSDDDTCSLSSSVTKHDEAFSLKFPKLRYVKVALLASLIIYTLISFISIQEKEDKWTNVAVQESVPAYVDLSHSLDLMFPVWKLRARGSFLPSEYGKLTNYSVVFTVVQLLNDSQGADRNGAYRLVKGPWAAPIAPPILSQYMNNEVEHVFKLTRGDAYDHIHRYQLRIDTNSDESVGLTVNMAGFSELSADGIILATTVLVFLYTLIIFEIVNRTLAAMLGATAAITCLTLIRDRPSLEKVVSWLDVETLCLLFGMMVLVAILCETGFFDYIAVVAFRIAKGRTWPLIITLCCITGVLSAFLDNVTTILLMTPITIRLCEIKNIDPKLVLIAQVMFSNIGGAATPVGDPPNVIIISSSKIQQQGVDFGRFTLHMMPGIVISFIATLIYIRVCYRSLSSNDLQEGNAGDIEDATPAKSTFGAVPYQRQHSNASVDNTQPRSHSEPQFGRSSGQLASSSTFGTTRTGATTRSNALPRIPSGSPTHLLNPLESSSEFDSYSYGQNQAQIRSRLLRSSSGKDALDQCFACNSMDDFCAGTSVRDSILDERRVFRSQDELKREIEVWKRATNSISGYSRDENSVRNVLNRKVEILETILQEHCYETVPPEDNYASVLAELEEKYKIRDYPLLYKSGVVMTLVISLFFMQSIPNLDLSLGWIAILGAILLLVLADHHEMESVISRVEWSTLIFFAALFVVMEALAELKFLWWIGRLTQDFINSVPEAHRLVVAILLFTWISALASSFIDNIPLTTVMVKILEDLAENNEFNIPLMPLIYALAFGACLGGNGTLIGASSNVVCAGVAEQHGYRFTFMDFFKVGFPIMLLTVGISSVYLIVCHVVFDWNY